MAQSALGRLGALAVAASFAQCSTSDSLPLITDGDSVRLLSSVSSCPDGADGTGYDDSSWQLATLPIGALPANGACLRKQFDIGSQLPDYRWLDIKLTSGSQARLNSGKGITSMEEQGLNWISGAGQSAADDETVVLYTLDLRLFPSLLQPKSNVLALQVPSMRQVEVAATLRRDYGNASPYVQVVNGPYVVHPTDTSVQLQWETDRSAPSWAVLSGQRFDGGWSIHHASTVSNLVPGRFYSFYVATAESGALPEDCAALTIEDDDELGRYVQRRDACRQLTAAVHSTTTALHTAAAGGAKLKLAIVGDTRTQSSSTNTIMAAVAKESPDVVVHTGDVVQTATEIDWQGFFAGAQPMLAAAPIVPVVGERDLSPWADRFSQLFALDGGGAAGHAYAVDLGPVHLALLDSTANAVAEASWLDADLTAAEAAGRPHIFVVMHAGPWSSGRSGGNSTALATIVPVIRAHHVDAVLSGHDNIYEHGVAGGQQYFISGGAGANVDSVGATAAPTVLARGIPHYVIFDIDGTSVTALAKDASGNVFDQVALSP